MTAAPAILHVDSEPGFRGGQRQLLFLAEGLAAAGLRQRVLARSPTLVSELQARGIAAENWAGASSPRGLARLHAASVGTLAVGGLVHVHDARSQGAARALLGRRSGRALVVHRRIDDVPSTGITARWKYAKGQVICVSSAVREVLLRWGLPAGRLHRVPSGVRVAADPPPLRAPPPFGAPLRLIAWGALVEHKGHADLLRALALARTRPAPRLDLLGGGPLRSELERIAGALGIRSQVRFLGDPGAALDPAARRALLRDCDLFVHPSRTEGLGTAVLDAMAEGLPVVATAAGGLREIVLAGETGWLSPPFDPRALAACIDDAGLLATAAPGRFAALGLAGWRRVQVQFNVAAMLAGVRAVYDHAARSAGRTRLDAG